MARLMPFGKYKGKPISSVPDDYLNWCMENFDESKLRSFLKSEVDRRSKKKNSKKKQRTKKSYHKKTGRDYGSLPMIRDTTPVKQFDILTGPKKATGVTLTSRDNPEPQRQTLDVEYRSIVGPPTAEVRAALDARRELMKKLADTEESLPITPEECPF